MNYPEFWHFISDREKDIIILQLEYECGTDKEKKG